MATVNLNYETYCVKTYRRNGLSKNGRSTDQSRLYVYTSTRKRAFYDIKIRS